MPEVNDTRETEIRKTFERLGLANDSERAQFDQPSATSEMSGKSTDFVVTRLSNSPYAS
jgi:hypothetical protein